jgi:hypothetical protein
MKLRGVGYFRAAWKRALRGAVKVMLMIVRSHTQRCFSRRVPINDINRNASIRSARRYEFRFEFRWGQEFSPLRVVQTGTVVHLASYTIGTGSLTLGKERKPDRSPPNSVKVKKTWIYTFTPSHVFSRRIAWLVGHKGSLLEQNSITSGNYEKCLTMIQLDRNMLQIQSNEQMLLQWYWFIWSLLCSRSCIDTTLFYCVYLFRAVRSYGNNFGPHVRGSVPGRCAIYSFAISCTQAFSGCPFPGSKYSKLELPTHK